MGLYLVELRRSPLRWWLPVFVLVDLAAVFGRSQWWIGVWPQASAAAQIPSLFFAPVLAAGAAWSASRARRHRMTEQLSAAALPGWRVEVVQPGATLTYGLVAYLLGMVAAATVSAPDAGPGFLWPGYVVLGACVIVASAAVGHIAGRFSASAFSTPIICGLGTFVLLGVLDDIGIDLYVLSGDPQLRFSPAALSVRVLCAVAFAAVAVLAPDMLRRGARWRPDVRRSAGAASALAVLLAAGLGTAVTGPLRVERAPVKPLCTRTAPDVCIWPENRKYLPELAAMMQRLNAIPGDLIAKPEVFYERGLRDWSAHPSDFHILEGSMWSVSPGMSGTIKQLMFPVYCPARDRATEEHRTLASFELGQWIEARLNGSGRPRNVHGGPPGVDFAAIGELLRQPEAVQRPWVEQRIAAIRDVVCG